MTKVYNFNLNRAEAKKPALKYNQNAVFVNKETTITTTMTVLEIRKKNGELIGMSRCMRPSDFDYDLMYALAKRDMSKSKLL